MILLVVILYAVLAATFTLAKITLAYAKPFFLVGTRMIVSGLLLLGYEYVKHSAWPKIAPQDWWLFIKTALFHIYLTFILDFWSLQYMSSTKSALIYSLSPFVAALLSYYLLHERLSRRKKLSIILGFIGVLPVVLTSSDVALDITGVGIPDLVLLCGMASGTYAWFLITDLVSKGYPLIFINGIAMLLGGIASLVTSFLYEGFWSPPVTHVWPFIGWTLSLIIASNIIFYNLYGYLLRSYSITFLSFAGFLSPLFTGLFGWLFLCERLGYPYVLSLVIIILSLWLFYTAQEESHS